MKIALDISPLEKGNYLQHRVRGAGIYIENLLKSLSTYSPQNKYITFTENRKIPSNSDIVHYPYFEPFFPTLPVIKRYKTVITIHDLIPILFSKYFPSGIKGRVKWEIHKRLLRRVDNIITDSVCSKKDILKYIDIPEEKVHAIYISASDNFKQILDNQKKTFIKKKYNLPDNFILYVGDATWNKNLPRLLSALEKTGEYLVMVGKTMANENYDKSNLWNIDLAKAQELAKRNKKILRLGFIPEEDLVILYNTATAFVMPSLYEGFGLPALEAMKCGCPVITSNMGSLLEVVDNSAFIVDPYSEDNIAKGIKKVFSDSILRASLVEKGLAQAKKFSWKKAAQETAKIYEKTFSQSN